MLICALAPTLGAIGSIEGKMLPNVWGDMAAARGKTSSIAPARIEDIVDAI